MSEAISQQMLEMIDSIRSEAQMRGLVAFMGIPARKGNAWYITVRIEEYDKAPSTLGVSVSESISTKDGMKEG